MSVILVWLSLSSPAAAESVTFPALRPALTGETVRLTGELALPEGTEPFPAMVLLHGCGGPAVREKEWAGRLNDWGYATLRVDSLGPRGVKSLCDQSYLVPAQVRAQDAHDAKAYLAARPEIDDRRIGVMGWSNGGWSLLYAIRHSPIIDDRGRPFGAAVAFYPYCEPSVKHWDAPLLILIGELDDWCPAERCRKMFQAGQTGAGSTLVVYPRAYHCFDWTGMDRIAHGHRLLYNPEAADDAISRTRAFLDSHLK